MTNKLPTNSDEAIDFYLDLYKDKHPDLFKDDKLLASLKVLLKDFSLELSKASIALTTAKIVKNLDLFAKYDLEELRKKPITTEELSYINSDPTLFVEAVMQGVYDGALDLIEAVGYYNVSVQDEFDKKGKKLEVEDNSEEIKLTTNQVGKA